MANRYVTEGNTVRVVREADNPRLRRKRELQRRTREAERERTKQKRGISITLPLTVILVVLVAVAVFFGYNYLCLKSSVDKRMENIKTLETRLETLRSENDAFEQSIDTSVDLNYVYNVAINELGMVHAGQSNVIQYDKNESEYVRQYENIPGL